jgi:hypothetical protein
MLQYLEVPKISISSPTIPSMGHSSPSSSVTGGDGERSIFGITAISATLSRLESIGLVLDLVLQEIGGGGAFPHVC